MKEEQNKPQKKKKEKWVDDGRTIADMNVDGMRGYRNENKNTPPKATFREQFRTFRKAFISVLPMALMVLVGFSAAAILVFLWLK